MDSRTSGLTDAALLLQAAATITATQNGATFDFAQGQALGVGNYAPGAGGAAMRADVFVSSYKNSATNETYGLQIQTSPDGVNWTNASRLATIGTGSPTDSTPNTGGLLQLAWSQAVRYARLVLTLGGTSPSLVLNNIYIQPMPNTTGH